MTILHVPFHQNHVKASRKKTKQTMFFFFFTKMWEAKRKIQYEKKPEIKVDCRFPKHFGFQASPVKVPDISVLKCIVKQKTTIRSSEAFVQ